jgi:ubiquinone/menaquinone biosynthesis C-methylase UbiE
MATHASVRTYFDKVATGYQAASSGLLWGRIRQREQNAVERLLGDVAGQDVLELGSGAGFYTRVLLDRGARHVWAVDISQRMLDGLPKERVTPVLGDAAGVAVGRSFDVLLSAGMLEFVPDPAAALANARRHATEGARIIILYPTLGMVGRAYRAFHRRNGMNIRLFAPGEMEALAQTSGWRTDATMVSGPFSASARLIAA